MNFRLIYIACAFLLFVTNLFANNRSTLPIVPKPLHSMVSGQTVMFGYNWYVHVDPQAKIDTAYISSVLIESGISIHFTDNKSNAVFILNIDKKISKNPEAYHLVVSKNRKITASAPANNGLLYALQTLRQIISCNDDQVAIPSCKVLDEPAFPWRAFMLDESRHFQGMETVKKLLDEMAYLKMNTFHWHLVDDPGWRIEIKKYSGLTAIGSKRDFSYQDLSPGQWDEKFPQKKMFYTQDEIREIVKYAMERGIKVVPEIEVPAHASASIAAYPWLGSSSKHRSEGIWGDLYDVTDPKVEEFIQDVLDEVIELFPSKIVHIGGDEADYSHWQDNPQITQFMNDNSIPTFSDLQVWSINRFSKYLASKNVLMMGWNEITGDNIRGEAHLKANQTEKLAEGTIVHFWDGDISLVNKAIDNGYDVVNSNRHFTYLDYPYEIISLYKAYSFNPTPQGLGKEKEKNILGLGCQMWGEFTPDLTRLYYQTFPRIAAFAECGWTKTGNKNYDEFRYRVKNTERRWRKLGYFNQQPSFDNSNAGILSGNRWITHRAEAIPDEADMYGDAPAPLFRKEFSVYASTVRKATLYITSAGYYRANLNGMRVGDIWLDPAWTDFSKRIYYSEYDITTSLKKGTNCLGVIIGNGFYNPLPLRMWGNRNLRDELAVGEPRFTARLVLEYSNGKTEEFLTDETWKFTSGPILKNNVYLGEWYDARWEISGWDKPGFDDSEWSAACVTESPGGKPEPRFFPLVRVTGKIPCIEITTPEDGIYLADMGTNFTGVYRIRLKGNPGDTVTFRFGERIYDDGSLNPLTTVCAQIKSKGIGGQGAPDVAWQTDTYIFGNNGDVRYSPEFTFHTFRYMEIKGLRYKPAIEDIHGLALNTDVSVCNSFECSSDLLNAIQNMCVKTFLSNLVGGVQSDCPAREKFGYGGDINAVSESYIYNFDMRDFYRKTIYDWVDAINDSVYIDTAPYVGIRYCGLSWESAFLFLQYQLWLYYDDRQIIEEMYDFNLNWMEKTARIHPGLIVDAGLGDHESLVPSPVQVTGTCHYLMAARVMKYFAGLMNDEGNKRRFERLENEIRDKLLDEFWYGPREDHSGINSQTLYSSLLYAGAIPEREIPVAVDSLMSSLREGINGRFITGIFGTKNILESMSANGLVQDVFDIVNSTGFPGWGFMIDNGATTLWETWQESDNVYSNCHPMFGSVSEWFYRWLGGIRPDLSQPGFTGFILEPYTPEGLSYVKTSYKTPHGYILSDWEKTKPGETVYHFSIPEGTTAVFKIKSEQNDVITIVSGSKPVKINKADYKGKNFEKELSPGVYVVSSKTAK